MAKDYLLSTNRYWDLWFQKFFSQIISIKVWIMLGAAFLLIFKLISSAELVTIWLAVLAIKGAYEIVDVFKQKKLKDGQECVADDEQSETETIQRVLNR